MRAAIALLLPAAACAQLELYRLDGTAEAPVGAVHRLPATAAGDVRDTRFRVRNNGPAAVSLATIRVQGSGFSPGAAPTLPYLIAPTAFADFTVRFAPASPGDYSASLTVNTTTVILLAAAQAGASVAVRADGVRTVLSDGAVVDFPRTEAGARSSRLFEIGNPGAAPLAVSGVSLAGGGFRASVPATFLLAAGEWISFEVFFEPPEARAFQATLAVEQRRFTLRGTGIAPPLQKPSILLDAPALASGQQRKVSLRFDPPPQAAGTGTLELAFRPAVDGLSDDPAVRFTASGARRASFTVAPGQALARFGDQTELTFQTGTTAGRVDFAVTLGAGQSGVPAPDFSVPIAPAAVVIDTARANRRANDLDVDLIGFDNTYSAGVLTFRFFDRSGAALFDGPVRVDAGASFKTYFAAYQREIGSAFLLRVSFPVTGDVNRVGAVEAEVVNAAGTARTQRLNFP
jgi:hypothetical protein